MTSPRPLGGSLFIDFETASDVDLAKHGVKKYVESPFFEPVCVSCCSLDTGVIESWRMTDDITCRDWLAARQPRRIIAQNAGFELRVLDRLGLGHWLDECEVFDTSSASARMDTGASQADMTKVWGVAEKLKGGKDLIKNWLCGVKVIPEDVLSEIVTYCEQDVRGMVELMPWLGPRGSFDSAEYKCHNRINRRGLCVDLDLVDFIARESRRVLGGLKDIWSDQACMITPAGNGNPGSVVCRRAISVALGGTGLESWGAKSKDFDDAPAELLAIVRDYNDLAGAAFKKLDTLRDRVSDDGRLYDAYVYNGQRTGRFSSRGVQMHNLPKPTDGCQYDEICHFIDHRDEYPASKRKGRAYLDLLKSCIRGAFVAPAGRSLVVGDFSQIEVRLQALLTDEDWMLDVFYSDGDIYRAAASKMFDTPFDAVTPEQRQLGKASTLALGYGSGVAGLVSAGYPVPSGSVKVLYGEDGSRRTVDGYILSDRVDLADDDLLSPTEKLQSDVNIWRKNRPGTCAAWRALDAAAMACIGSGRRQDLWLSKNCMVAMTRETTPVGNILHVTFATCGIQVHLCWPGVRVKDVEVVDKKTGDIRIQRRMTYSSGLKKGLSFWGGTIFENICQSLAARCLQMLIASCDGAGLEPIGHVHDELLLECDEGDAERVADMMRNFMRLEPFGDLLKGDVWTGKRYGKN